MKRTPIACLLLAGLALALAAPALAEGPAKPAPPAWQKLQSLAGNWQAPGPDGKPMRTSYELVAGGSALLEKFEPGFEPSMVTVYTMDGETPVLTHYCTAGNQPRMRAQAGSSTDVLDFAFVDAANLTSKEAGHMHHLKLSFVDANHLSQEWTFHKDGKDSAHTMTFERVK